MEAKAVKEKKIMGPVWGWLVFTLLGGILLMVGEFIGTHVVSSSSDNANLAHLICVAVLLIYVFIYDIANRKTFDGCFKPHKMGIGFLLLVPWLVLALIGLVINVLSGNNQMSFTVSGLVVSIWAGVCEETVFRAVPAAHMMRCCKNEKDILKVAILTSIAFGLIHAANSFAGAEIGFTILQIVYAFALGMLLCASYLRSGSIVPAMVCHFTNDIIAFLNQNAYSSTGLMENSNAISTSTWVMSIINTVVCLAIAIYALRPAKREEIMQLWAEKWHKDII